MAWPVAASRTLGMVALCVGLAAPISGSVSVSRMDIGGATMRLDPNLAASLVFSDTADTQIWNGDSSAEFMDWRDEFFVDWRAHRSWRFRWRNPNHQARRAEWQVLVFEPASGASWRNPPGLVASGPLDSAPHGEAWAQFEIKFDPWAPAPPDMAPPPADEPSDLEIFLGIIDLIESLQDEEDEPPPDTQRSAQSGQFQGTMRYDPSVLDSIPFASADPRTYWVRVLPLTATGDPAGPPSSPAKMLLGTPDLPEFDWTDDPDAPINQSRPRVEIVEYQPIRWADDPHLWWLVTQPVPFAGYEVGDKIYWDPAARQDKSVWDHIGDGIGAIVDAFESAVNWVSTAYDDIKAFAVRAVADTFFPNCGPCRTALSMGLDYGLAAVGAPPSLPNFDELTDMGKGYLIESVAAETGLPPEAVEMAVDRMAAEAKRVADHGPGGNQWLRPHPDHQYRPAFVRVLIHNPANQPRSGSLVVRLGRLFKWRSVPVPPIPPGGSLEIPVVLDQDTDYWIRKWIRENNGSYAGEIHAMRGWWDEYEGGGTELSVSFNAVGPQGYTHGGGQALTLQADTAYVRPFRFTPMLFGQ